MSAVTRWRTGYALGHVPICLGCHRRRFGMNVELGPPSPEWREERCRFCGQRTNHGLYLEPTGERSATT